MHWHIKIKQDASREEIRERMVKFVETYLKARVGILGGMILDIVAFTTPKIA